LILILALALTVDYSYYINNAGDKQMNNYKFEVVIAFLNKPFYKATVAAINGYQATQQAIRDHRLKTGCGTNEMYDSSKSTFQQINWIPVDEIK
jgi:hypothetical protein